MGRKITKQFIDDFIAGKVSYPARQYKVKKYNDKYWRVWDSKRGVWVDNKITRVKKRANRHAEHIQLLADTLKQGGKS